MPEIWQVVVKRPDGSINARLTGQRDGFVGFSFTRRVNSPGAFLIYFMRRADESEAQFLGRADVFEVDSQIEFWRRWQEQDIDWQLEGEFLNRSETIYTTVEGGTMLQAAGRGYLDLLHRRIIEAYSDSAEAAKSGPAESVIKEYVNEQAGPGAGARAIAGLSIEADGLGGDDGNWRKQFTNLLDTVQEITRIGGGDLDVVGVGDALFEFRWYAGQRGTDRSTNIIFSLERGNMGQPNLALKHHDEVNAILVGGQGAEAARILVWRTDAARIADSPLNRIERWRDARQEPDMDGLLSLGDEFLDEGRPKETLTFIPLQTPGTILGRDYFFGDLVTGRYMGHQETKKVMGYTYTWNEQNQEVTVELEDA